ncbi:MAG: T9SS type A sorting domain-containing protein [Bacteroidota bacterium]
MKKITLVVGIGFASLFSFGQQKSILNAPQKLVNPKLKTSLKHTFSADPSREFSGWLNYALQLDAVGGPNEGLAAGQFGLVFPDSTIIAGVYTGGDAAYPQFHKYATMLDAKNMPLQGIIANSSFTLDSVAIAYAYLRTLASTVVDTLVVTIIKQVTASNYNMGAPGNENYQDITYNFATKNVPTSMILGTYKYFLTESDSTNNVGEIYIQTTGIPVQTNGAHIGAIVSFIPGYSYSITDSISEKNAFYQFSYEQNGEDTDPTYYGGAANDFAADMNCSYVLPRDVRYNINTNGWNGYFMPSWGWTTPYGYENHIISFKVDEILGINDISENGITVKQNMPNPFSNNSSINYELDHNAAVTLNVYDVTGKKVLVQTEGNQNIGRHTINVNANDLPAGVYYYSLNVGKHTTSTMKMVVIK